MEQINREDNGFADFVKRTLDIQELSSPKLTGIASPDEYSAALRQNYQQIGELSLQNRELISNDLMPVLQSEGELPDEEASSLRELSDMMLDAYAVESVDIFFRDLINKRLMQDARSRNDVASVIRELDKELENNCILATQMARITSDSSIFFGCLERAIAAHDELMTYLEPSRFEALDAESRETVMVDSRYGVNAIWGFGNEPIRPELRQRRLEIPERMKGLAADPFYRKMLPEYDWDCHRLRCLEYIVSSPSINHSDGYTREEMARISAAAHEYRDLWNSDPEKFAEMTDESFVIDSINLVYYLNGEMSEDDYLRHMMENYRNRDPEKFDCDSSWANLAVPAEILFIMGRRPLSEEEALYLDEMYHSVLRYLFHAQKSDSFFDMINLLGGVIDSFIEFAGGMQMKEFALELFAAIHPPTYVHVTMVAMLSRCIARHLLKQKPELFVGICDCPNAESVPDYADRIMDYTFDAAQCHDFGKLIIMDTIYVYGRRIMDPEFNLIKQHPALGAEIMAEYSSTRDYIDVALGHHRWYNDQGGYPASFQTKDSPVKTIIDIVACADCMDAATDRIGRSYSKGKDLDGFLAELSEGAGMRYAPYLPELLALPEVRKDIEFLLAQGRQDIYKKTYTLLKDAEGADD